MESVLRQTWQEDVLPLLKDRSMVARVGRAGLLAAFGAIVGEVADLACQWYFRKKFGFGARLGGVIGATAGAFSPEIINWAAAYNELDEGQREFVDDRIRMRVVARELIELLGYFELAPTASLNELKRAYKQKVLAFHPDRNKSSDAHVKMVAINAARERLLAAYASGLLPLAA